MNIAVLLGGTSPERYVSMASGKGIAEALISAGHNVRLYDPALGNSAEVSINDLVLPTEMAPTADELAAFSNREVIAAIQSIADDTDVAFLALHGVPGEDGVVQALLQLRGIPYTGSEVLASALAINKAMTKRILSTHDIETPRWFLVEDDGTIDLETLRVSVYESTGYPVVVKPNDGGSTVGLTIVQEESQLLEAFHLASRYSKYILFEEYTKGRELTVAVLGDEALPVVEIRPKSGYYDYTNKYTAGRTDYLCPAPLDRAAEEELKEIAFRAHTAVGCRGYSRVDFILDEDGVPWCLEVNTLPGMTATSLVPKAAKAVGLDFVQLCEWIVEYAVNSQKTQSAVS